jgi:hypothetical protein
MADLQTQFVCQHRSAKLKNQHLVTNVRCFGLKPSRHGAAVGYGRWSSTKPESCVRGRNLPDSRLDAFKELLMRH